MAFYVILLTSKNLMLSSAPKIAYPFDFVQMQTEESIYFRTKKSNNKMTNELFKLKNRLIKHFKPKKNRGKKLTKQEK